MIDSQVCMALRAPRTCTRGMVRVSDEQTRELPQCSRSRPSSDVDGEDSHSFDSELRAAARLQVPSPCSPGRARASTGGRWPPPDPDAVVSGKYRVHESLGAGGMGTVLRATHLVSGRQVALKWLTPRCGQASVRFIREARAAGRIDHPNVVDVYDLGTHEGGHYLVMELLRGCTLRDRLGAGKLTPRELTEIMVPVLHGVAAAHAQGVIHRDLKPDNVFLCEAADGSPREPKVLDFGIAKIRADLDAALTLTRPGALLGTLPYMSPEQLEDAPEIDERTDIYAAGVMMYEALTGRRPFRASSDGALVRAILAQEPPPLRELAPGVSLQLERIVMRAMAKKPAARQPDVQTLINELQSQERQERLERAPHEGSWRSGGPPGTWRLVLGLATAVLAIGGCLLAGWPEVRRPAAAHATRAALTGKTLASQAPLLGNEPVSLPLFETGAPVERVPAAAPVQRPQPVRASTWRAAAERAPKARVRARAGAIRIDEL
jgi:serine/threonine protein kinase